MPRIKITREDMMMGKAIPPTWYTVKIKACSAENNKAGDALNYVTDFIVTQGEHKETPIRVWLSEKQGPGLRLLGSIGKACGVREGADGSVDFEPEKLVGRELEVYVTNELYNGDMTNKVKDARPLAKAAAA